MLLLFKIFIRCIWVKLEPQSLLYPVLNIDNRNHNSFWEQDIPKKSFPIGTYNLF